VAVPSSLLADDATTTTLAATLLDAYLNPVPGIGVTFTATGAGNTLVAGAGTTDADGRTTATLRSAVAEPKTVTAAFDVQSVTTQVFFTAGGGDAGHSTLTASAVQVVADDTAQAEIAVTVRDPTNNPVPDAVVAFAASGSGNTFSAPSCTTGSAGTCSVTLRSTAAEAKTVTASFGASQTATVSVTFTAGPAASGHSKVEATPASVTADDAALATLTATVRDQYDNLVPNMLVTFTATGQRNTLSSSTATTGASGAGAGVASVTLRSRTAETKTITATFGASQSATTTVKFVAGAPLATKSTFGAAPSSLSVDSTSGTTLSATLRDLYDNLVPDAPVTFSATGAGNTLSATTVSTNASGYAAVTLTSTKAEAKTATASFGASQSLTTGVTFTQGAPASSTSSVAASPPSQTADNSSTTTLTASIADAKGNPVSGAAVSFSSSGSNNTFNPANAACNTSGAGTCSLTLRSSRAETKTITISFGTGQSATTTAAFTAGTAVAGQSTFTTDIATVKADNTATATLTATLKDTFGNPVPNVSVTFTSNGSGNSITPGTANTNASGVATATMTSTKAEAKTLMAAFGTASLTSSVTFVAGDPVAAQSVVTPSLSSAVANGTATISLAPTIKDQFGNPVANIVVSFASSGSSNTFSSATCTTGAAGTCAAAPTIKSTKAEVKTITASFGSSQSVTCTVTFTAGAPVLTKSSVTATGPTTADNTAVSTLTATINDANNNGVPNIAVTFSATGTGNTPSAATVVTTDATGRATLGLKSTKAETKTITATYPTSQVLSTTAVFTAGPAAQVRCTIAVSATTPTANNTATTAVTATLKDQYDNLVSGAVVDFSATGTGNTWSTTQCTTGATGACPTAPTLKSTKAEAKTITATTTGVTLTANVTFKPGPASGAHSSVTANPASPVAGTSTTLTATIADLYDNVIPNVSVTFTVAPTTGNTLTGSPATTDSAGQASASLKSTKAEKKTVTASFPTTQTATGTVTFVAAAPDASHSTLAANPTSLAADDATTTTLTLTVGDAWSNPVPNAGVVMSASGTGHTFGALTGTTGTNGQFQTTLRSGVDQAKTVSAAATASTTTVTPTVVVTFTEAKPEILSVNGPTPMSGCETLTYTLKQTQSRPVDVRVEYALTGTGTFVAATRHTTQGDGLMALTSSPAGTTHTFVWASTFDVPHAGSTTARVRITPSRGGVDGTDYTLSGQTVKNQLAFASPVSYGVGDGMGPAAIAVADFNRDGYKDLVVADRLQSAVSVMLGQQGGTYGASARFLATTTSQGPMDLAVADFNGDGVPDVATADNYAASFTVLLGNGSGGLGDTNPGKKVATTGMRPVAVVAGDFNNDGKADVALGDAETKKLVVAPGNGDGTFGALKTTTITGGASASNVPRTMVAGDFNRDGKLDLVVALPGDSQVAVFTGKGDGTFNLPATGTTRVTVVGPVGLAMAPLNRNGRPDVVVRTAAGNLVPLLQNASGSLVAGTTVSTGNTVSGTEKYDLVLADLDLDGALDAAGATGTSMPGGAWVLRGQGNGTFFAAVQLAAPGTSGDSRGIATADMNGDGRPDLVTANFTGNDATVYLGSQAYRCDAQFRSMTTVSGLFTTALQMAQADFDGNGWMDIATADQATTSGVRIAWGTAPGTCTSPPCFTPGTAVAVPTPSGAMRPTSLVSADFDHDGWPDLAAVASTGTPGDYVAVLYNNSRTTARTWSTNNLYAFGVRSGTSDPSVVSVGAGDLDRDGWPDLVVARASGGVRLLTNKRDPTRASAFNAAVAGPDCAGAKTVPVVADFNQDGLPDIACSGDTGYVYRATGLLSYTQAYATDAQSYIDVVLGDLNGDGWQDLLLANSAATGGLFAGLVNNLTGGFTRFTGPLLSPAPVPASAVLVDLDGDGYPDVVEPGTTGNATTFFLNGTGVRAQAAYSLGTPAPATGDIVGGDYDFDGVPDVGIQGPGGTLLVLRGR